MQVPVSPEVNGLIDDATSLSVRRGTSFVGVEHLYGAVLQQEALIPKAVTERYTDALLAASQELTKDAWRTPIPADKSDVFYTPRCAEAVNTAARLAERLSSGQPTAGHLLLALLADAHAGPSRAMDRLNLPRGEIIAALRTALAGPSGTAQGTRAARTDAGTGEAQTAASPSRTVAVAEREGQSAASAEARVLESVTRDLTEVARQGQLEPAIGRDREIGSVLEILARKNKNNVILVGEAGVGKTRVAEGLARLMAKKRLRGMLAATRMLELNVAALMAGTQYRGAFEEKLAALVDELKGSRDTILFIDEIHLMMGAGATDGSGIDMANLLKPALARGEIACIGATTMREYRRFIEKDPAIERRFQEVRIEPLSPSSTWEVLKRIKPSLEEHHGVRISTKALRDAVTLTERYMPNRHLPEKAIDVIDQACARHRLRAIAARENPAVFDRPHERDGQPTKVTPHDVRRVISRNASVPIEEITAEERMRVSRLERRLLRRIIGQDQAVAKVVAAVKKSRAGLADPNRPDAAMLFLGPTGVGKTQLAKSLAELLFGAPGHLVTFDMSEYVEAHSVSRLLGAPPGYVGSEEEGLLTETVRNAPFSILLFDEIEKAHPRIFDIFLPVLDEGRLKDSRGRMVSFRHTIIIFTSNIGADTLSGPGEEEDWEATMNALREQFRPEFINRLDEIVPFYPLMFENIRTILALAMRDLQHRLTKQGLDLHVYQGAYEYLAEQGYDPEYGAREIRRVVERRVTQPISDLILKETVEPGDAVEVLMEEGAFVIRKAKAAGVSGGDGS